MPTKLFGKSDRPTEEHRGVWHRLQPAGIEPLTYNGSFVDPRRVGDSPLPCAGFYLFGVSSVSAVEHLILGTDEGLVVNPEKVFDGPWLDSQHPTFGLLLRGMSGIQPTFCCAFRLGLYF